MSGSRNVLLTSTALALVLAALPASAASLEVSASPPGDVHTVVGNEMYDTLGVGVGANEIGTLIIGAGTTLTSGIDDSHVGAVIGSQAGASGTVTIDGAGAKWTDQSGWAHLGDYGAGDLTVRNGGELSTWNFIVANRDSGSGTVTVDGVGSLWANEYNIEIGRDGTGAVIVSGGAEVTNATLRIGFGDGATGTESETLGQGTLTVTDAGSTWVNSGGVSIYADATLIVEKGGAFETVDGGLYTKHGGTITVTGAGTTMKIGTLHSTLPVDWEDGDGWFSPDSGTILIADGARLEADGGYVGGSGDVAANMTVTGAGTVWENYLSLYIGGTGGGGTGTGKLTVSDGAQVSAYTTAIGVDAGSTGTVVLTGAGTLLKSMVGIYSGNIRVGFNGTGTLVVQDGATAEAEGALVIADKAGSTGTFVIGAAEGDQAAATGTLVSAGGVVFGDGDATLVFNHTSDDYEFAHVLSGYNGAIRQLAGVTDLTGYSSLFTGVVDVLGGTLKVNGYLQGAEFYVGSGGTLGGAGTIGRATVHAGGILAPGNSTGTLLINEDLVLEAGSYFDVEIDGTGNDKVFAEYGDVYIEDGAILRLSPSAGTQLGTDYTIIELDNNSNNVQWDDGFTVENDRRLLDSYVDYANEDVTVRFEAVTSPWSALLDTPNQGAVADAVQGLGIDSPLYEAALFLDDDVIGETFDLLSGEIHASTKGALITDGEFLRSAVFDRMAVPGGTGDVVEPQGYAAAPAGNVPFPGTENAAAVDLTSVWSQAYGAWGSTDADGNAADFDRRSGGLFIGADTLLEGWRVGLVGGYGQSSFASDDRASTGTGATVQIGAYAGTSIGAVNLRGGAGYALTALSTTRNVTIPDAQELTADYDAALGQVFGEVGYTLDTGAVAFEPFAGVALVNLSTAAYAEAGGSAALSADASSADVTFATLGLRGSSSTDIGGTPAVLSGMLGWRHAVGDTATAALHSFADSDTFMVGGLPVAADTLLLQLGLGMSVGASSSLDLSYDGEFAADTDRQTLRGSLTTKF